MSRLQQLLILALALVMAGCSTFPQPRDSDALQREAVAGTELPPPPPARQPLRPTTSTPKSTKGQISLGNGVFVHNIRGPKSGGASSAKGDVTFNFENQPVQAVVKAILGDFLHASYAIAPNVDGNVTFSTAQPVARAQALPILETLLSWTGNALVKKDGRYLVLPSKQAVAGNLTPSLGATPPANGFSTRLFQLHYVSAPEMKKLLQPFATKDAFLLVDPNRNVLVMAGTASQLDNYQRTIQTFDVDWLKGMSVGVFGLQRANVDQLMPQLQKLFGAKGSTPLAGMVRFIPIERTNSIVVISPQPDYLREVHQWIDRIDRGGGNQPQLYVYDVKNVQATYLASYLNQIYNPGASSGGGADTGGGVGPGLNGSTLGSNGGGLGGASRNGASGMSKGSDFGSDSNGGLGSGSGNGTNDSVGLPPRRPPPSGGGGGGAVSAAPGSNGNGGNGISITAVDENNQLMVRCRPSQWAQMQSAIRRLDVVPLQVQIETRILEVSLVGKFSLGVQWYLENNVVGSSNPPGGFGDVSAEQKLGLGQGGLQYSGNDALFYSFIGNNLQAAVHAIETNGNTKILSAPSLVVMNNQDAMIQVGTQIPVNQTYFTPGINGVTTGSGSGAINTLGSVQYKDTGVILQVRPRVNPGGLVYLALDQVVSKPGQVDQYGNFPIDKRELATQVAVQSGQTVMLGGLIQQNDNNTDSGIPFLNRIPLLGRLFGSTDHNRNRTELLVLITPRVIANSADARRVTNDYQDQFQSLQPIRVHNVPQASAPSRTPQTPVPANSRKRASQQGASAAAKGAAAAGSH